MRTAIKRSEPLGKTAEIRPYLQAFTLGPASLHAGSRAGADPRRERAGHGTRGYSGIREARTKPAIFRPKTTTAHLGAQPSDSGVTGKTD